MFNQLDLIDPTPSDYQTTRPTRPPMPLRDVVVAGMWSGALIALLALVLGWM